MLRWLLAGLCGTALLAFGVELRADPFAVAGWAGESFSDNGGSFSHCAVAAPFAGGDMLSFVLRKDGSFAIGVERRGWELSRDHLYPIELRIDDAKPQTTQAKAVDRHGMLAEITKPAPIYNALRKGRVLEVGSGRKGSVRFELSGSGRALQALFACVADSLGGDNDDEGDDDGLPQLDPGLEPSLRSFPLT